MQVNFHYQTPETGNRVWFTTPNAHEKLFDFVGHLCVLACPRSCEVPLGAAEHWVFDTHSDVAFELYASERYPPDGYRSTFITVHDTGPRLAHPHRHACSPSPAASFVRLAATMPNAPTPTGSRLTVGPSVFDNDYEVAVFHHFEYGEPTHLFSFHLAAHEAVGDETGYATNSFGTFRHLGLELMTRERLIQMPRYQELAKRGVTGSTGSTPSSGGMVTSSAGAAWRAQRSNPVS